MVNLDRFLGILDRIAPAHLAESWDTVGLQIGSRHWPVRKIWTALDPLPDVVEKACSQDVDLLITHHPLLFKPVHQIDCDTPLGRIIQMAVSGRLAIYSMHTNLDSVTGGVNDVLAERIGLTETRVLAKPAPACDADGDPREGLGRVGELPVPESLGAFAEYIKDALKIGAVKVVGNLAEQVETVAVCSGSGASLLTQALGSGAQVYVSGDLGYHTARDAQQAGIGLIDIGHFGSEHLIVDVLASSIRDACKAAGLDVIVEAATMESDPFYHL